MCIRDRERIDRLSTYMDSSGKSYKNHLATIRTWARRDAERGMTPKAQVQALSLIHILPIPIDWRSQPHPLDSKNASKSARVHPVARKATVMPTDSARLT